MDECRDGCCCEELYLLVTPPFCSSGDAKIGKEERNGSFGEMILWSDVKRLMLKISESERIDAPAGPLTIVVFSGAVPTVVLRGVIGAYVQHAPERCCMQVCTGVPSGE